jgi:tetratricopeptide (TPR) repeat protein
MLDDTNHRPGPPRLRDRLSVRLLLGLGLVMIPYVGFGSLFILFPNRTAEAHFNRGVTWSMKKEYRKAIAELSEAIRRDPHNADYRNWRGHVWNETKEFDEAIG